MKYIFIDFETRSALDVTEVGPICYAKHSTTRPLIFAYAGDCGNGILVDFDIDFDRGPFEEIDLGQYTFVAHNAQFERAIWRNCLPHWKFPRNWLDTSAMAKRAGLPGSLDGATAALGVAHEKDPIGKKLINIFSKLQRPTKKSGRADPYFIEPWDRPDEFRQFCEYCYKDVLAEMDLFYRLDPRIMTSAETVAMFRNWAANERGIYIDTELLEASIYIIGEETKRANQLIADITNGQITTINQNARIAAFCGMESIAANEVSDQLELPDLDADSAAVLRLRRDSGKSSVAKLHALSGRLVGGRAHDLTIYHGAHTGRETGGGPQPLNLPRGNLKDRLPRALELCRGREIETLRSEFGSPINVVSGILRSLFVPAPGKMFYCVDMSQIEARLVFWFSGESGALNTFATGGDLYKELAATIYNEPLESVTKEQREVGKRGILGLGYGMGSARFVSSVKQYANLTIDQQLGESAKRAYRKKYFRVVRMWKDLENAAIAALHCADDRGCTTHNVSFYRRDRWLICKLPSGRELHYFDPAINSDGQLTYMSMEASNGKRIWNRVKTYGGKLTENVVQSTARDLLQYFMNQIERIGYNIALTVYDEILAEKANGDLSELLSIMKSPPVWCADLPLNADGWEGEYYHK